MDPHPSTPRAAATAGGGGGAAPDPTPSFRALADALPEMVWIARSDGSLQWANRRWREYVGPDLPPDALLPEDRLHPDDRAAFRAAWARGVVTGSPLDIECRLRRHDGAYRWHLARASSLAANSGPGGGAASAFWAGSFTDVHAQKAAEAELRDRQEWQRRFLRDVLRAVTEGKLSLCERPEELPRGATQTAGERIPVTRGSLSDVRALVLEACRAAGFDEGRAHDLMTAASESAMNALVHAGGGTVSVGLAEGGTVQVRVEDGGSGIALDSLHRATLEKGFTTAGSMGYGFYMMLQTCDRIHLLTGPGGTTVVLEQDAIADDTPYPDRAIVLPAV